MFHDHEIHDIRNIKLLSMSKNYNTSSSNINVSLKLDETKGITSNQFEKIPLLLAPSPANNTTISSTNNKDNSSKIYYTKFSSNRNLEWLSLLFFFFGGCFFTCISTWDILLMKQKNIEQDNDDGIEIIMFGSRLFSLYLLIYLVAGLGYFMTALTDLYICRCSRMNSHTIPVITPASKSSHISTTFQLTYNCSCNSEESTIISPSSQNIHKSVLLSISQQIRHEEIVAILLGIAACFDIAGGLVCDINESLEEHYNFIACHFYFLEAFVALFGQRWFTPSTEEEEKSPLFHDYYDNNNASTTMDIVYYLDKSGDLLFLIGSIIDLISSYFFVNARYEHNVQLGYWDLVSNILWTLDALLYFGALFISERNSVIIQNKR